MAACGRAASPGVPFRFPEDTPAFVNDTVWEYVADPASGTLLWTERRPRPAFALQCGSLARSVRQFHVHARFEPEAPRATAEQYAALIARVLDRDPRRLVADPEPVAIPGYADLRSFSREHESAMKRLIRGPASYLQRGNWRMIFRFWPGEQRRVASSLVEAVARGETPIVHVLRYPAMSVNHMVLVYAVEETPDEVRFTAYDPNDAEAPVVLRWDRGARTFVYPRTRYFLGGPVRAYEIYDGPFY